jgi:ABC-type glycerol-3-phosphate transport system permease component
MAATPNYFNTRQKRTVNNYYKLIIVFNVVYNKMFYTFFMKKFMKNILKLL